MSTPIVALPNGLGSLRGVQHATCQSFLGIPYAAAPVGPRRFQPPQQPEAWDAVREATAYGPWAPQTADVPGSPLPRDVVAGDDFLTLNVWTPDTQGRAPVMVFIHGGSFTTGSGAVPAYDGMAFARDGVVLVTINYRLGVEGFLWTGEGTPNLGLLDQVAALRWVQDNICAFGGDPSNVTVFGESAGAMSVVTLMTMPMAKGLFQRAIAESGAGENVHDNDTARMVSQRLAEHLGVAPTLAGIGAVPQAELLAGLAAIETSVATSTLGDSWGDVARTLLPFCPVIDGNIVPAMPRDLMHSGAAHDVDFMLGTNAEEARLFFVPDGSIGRMDPRMPTVLAHRYGAQADDVQQAYHQRGIHDHGDVAAAVLTDGFYRVPALRIASHQPNAYLYQFTWKSPAYDGKLGSCHALELPFVFDNLDSPDVQLLLGGQRPQHIADRMHAAWIAFARTGNPGWQPFREGRASMEFGDSTCLQAPDRTVDPACWPTIEK
ncbi:carboxylesterase/lipase family protein [Mycolicibacterium sp. 22603]|uniref:carboxylesterase/lipase family protein n=1 Tax=Mycolicibacterium sp. 22603 TaxID=3453950 RepID=UPI003F8786F5